MRFVTAVGHALLHLGERLTDNQIRLVAAGVIPVLTQAQRAHPDVEVLTAVLTLLRDVPDTQLVDALPARLRLEDGLAAVVAGMRVGANSLDLQRQGCVVLGQLRHTIGAKGILAAQGHDVVLAALKAFPNDVELVCLGGRVLGSLVNMAADASDRDMVARAGGFEAALAVLALVTFFTILISHDSGLRPVGFQ